MPEAIHSEHFKNGLREDSRVPNNTEALTVMDGMKAMAFGASKELTVSDGTDGLTTAWPFPQLFKGEGFTLCLDSDILYLIDDSGDKQAITVYAPTVSGSELMADTDMSSWDDSASEWTISGTEASKVAGAESSISDTITSVPAGLYRMSVTVTAVDTTESSNDKMYVRIGGVANASESIIPKVGVMEFDVLTTGAETVVHIFGESDAEFTVSGATLRAIANIPDLGFGSTTKPFHMASFGRVWFLASDSGLLLCAPICGTKGAYSDLDISLNWRVVRFNTTQIGAVANFNERLYLGDFDGTDSRYDSAEFTEVFDIFIKKHVGVIYENFDVSKNVVFYGQWAGGDISYPFSADLALFGLLETIQSAAYVDPIRQSMRDGGMGFFELPLHGRLLRLVPMGGFIIAYCDNGVCAIQPTQDNANLHSVKIISQVGLSDKGAVAADPSLGFQMYLGVNGKLIIISNELVVRELGYEEFLSTMNTNKATAPPILAVDPDESEVYIGDGSSSYIRTRSGMGEIWTAVTSLSNTASDGLVGAVDDISPAGGKVRLRTVSLDYGTRSFKSLHDAEIGAYDVSDLRFRAHFKNDHGAVFTPTEWFEVIGGGFTIPVVSFYEISYELEFTPGANARIEYIKADWQVRDHRNFRRQAGRL